MIGLDVLTDIGRTINAGHMTDSYYGTLLRILIIRQVFTWFIEELVITLRNELIAPVVAVSFVRSAMWRALAFGI